MRTRVALLATLLLAAPARAQEEAPLPVTEADLTVQAGWGPKEGHLVELANAKFRDFFQPNVRLVKVANDRLRLDSDKYKQLADNLARWQTADGPLDKKGRSNVR